MNYRPFVHFAPLEARKLVFVDGKKLLVLSGSECIAILYISAEEICIYFR